MAHRFKEARGFEGSLKDLAISCDGLENFEGDEVGDGDVYVILNSKENADNFAQKVKDRFGYKVAIFRDNEYLDYIVHVIRS